MTMRVELLKQLNGHPAVGVALRAHADMITKGLATDTHCMVGWDDLAVVAYEGEEIVGIITFGDAAWISQLSIKIGWVSPERRKHGIYRKLWQRLVEYAQEKERAEIVGTTLVENTAMRAIAKQLGRIEHSINLAFPVPPITRPDANLVHKGI